MREQSRGHNRRRTLVNVQSDDKEQAADLGSNIARLFDRLDAWRHFPAYQLERRADIFFSLYLRGVIEHERGVTLADAIIPEVPIKSPHNAQSFKVDYLLCTSDHSLIYLVELKTDPRSRRDEQDTYLTQAAAAGITALLEGIHTIVLATKHRRKYFHLLRELATLGLLHLPRELEMHMFSDSQAGVLDQLRRISVADVRPKIEVLYVQPLPGDGPNHIDFECFARHVARHSDPLSQRFSESLLRWRTAAGEQEVRRELAKVHA